MDIQQRPLFGDGNSYKELMALPDEIIDIFGFALGRAQRGEKHDAAKPLKGFGGAGVLEVVAGDKGGIYRTVYAVIFPEAVFVLHCFQKKSKKRVATPNMTTLACQTPNSEKSRRTWPLR
ncbi:MAG: type II toxin-antitoxin system RelE/ParE family toxin [Desulfovibrionales bacterium]|nr:MAG: type II toxin-antitoxin system RelE/ParE family toxin [Desulfovibrionales bacterium]